MSSNILAIANCTNFTERRQSSKDCMEQENSPPPTILPKNEIKNEYDIKDAEINELENFTNSKFICNIGVGGFSVVKLIYNYTNKCHFALKVVKYYNFHRLR